MADEAKRHAYFIAYNIARNAKRKSDPLINEAHKAESRAYYATHKEESRARSRAFHEINQEYKKNYRKANSQRNIVAWAHSKAKRLGIVINDLTPEQWEEIKKAYGYCCVYCGKKPKTLEMDHILPLGKGGPNTVSNVVPSCRSCNAKKHLGPPQVSVQPLLLTIAPKRKKP